MKRHGLFLALASFAGIAHARGGDVDVPHFEHVRLEIAGKVVSGCALDPSAAGGYALLADDGRIEILPRSPAPRVLKAEARPVTGLPSGALVAGLSHAELAVRDRCQALLRTQGVAALAAIDAALDAESADARRRALALVAALAPGQEKTVKLWLARTRQRLDDPDEAVREMALRTYAALGGTDPDDLLHRCESALAFDQSARVRHEAIVQLGRSRDLRAVDVLLDHLADCEERSLRLVTFDGLRRLTAKNFGRDEARWRNWWTNHRAELVPAH